MVKIQKADKRIYDTKADAQEGTNISLVSEHIPKAIIEPASSLDLQEFFFCINRIGMLNIQKHCSGA